MRALFMDVIDYVSTMTRFGSRSNGRRQEEGEE
jgi:hypothetical protein